MKNGSNIKSSFPPKVFMMPQNLSVPKKPNFLTKINRKPSIISNNKSKKNISLSDSNQPKF